MWTEEQFIELEQEERTITDEGILAMILLLGIVKGNLEKELRAFYQKYGKDGVVTYTEARKWVSEQDHTKRLTALTMYMSGEFEKILPKATDEFEKLLRAVIQKESGFFDIEVDEDKILEKKWGNDESTWDERLEDDILLWVLYFANDWKRAMLQRKHLDDVLKQLDKRFNSIESVLTTLGLSESTAVGSLVRQKIFRELGYTKYQFYTKADERTCETCGSMHGLIFPMSAYEVGVTASPVHPRCRCWEVPIRD